MKIQTHTVVKVLELYFLLATFIFAQYQGDPPSMDPEREVIVMFRSDAVIPPENRTEGRPDEFQIPGDGLRQLLVETNVETIARLLPDFRPEDRFAISRTGETVQLTDWTHIYVIRLPQATLREAFVNALERRPEVVFAEINGRSKPDFIPNDPEFHRQWALKNDGTPFQGSGTSGADIKAYQAWDITTGSTSINIGIVDDGMQTDHPDFAGRVTGDPGDNAGHGTGVAGVAAAQGDNTIGIAGVAWNVGIINEDYGAGSDADNVAAVLSAASRGADVINNSWVLLPVGRYSDAVRSAFADVYKLNRVSVASMGNEGAEVIQYPAAFGQGMITVGATTNEDVKADRSSTGDWIDIVAPGGAGVGSPDIHDDIYSTLPFSTYAHFAGTSFAAPVATGLAALLLSVDSSLYNDDIEQIIRLGVDDLGSPGFDTWYGTGRVNARKALDLIRPPYVLEHWSASGGSSVGNTGSYQATWYSVPGLADGVYLVKRYDVRKTVTFPQAFSSTPYAWGRGVATNGYSTMDPNFGMGWCDVVPGSVTATGATLQTYVYEVWNLIGPYLGWYPNSPGNVTFAYTVLSPPPENLTLENMTVSTTEVYAATNSITAGPAFTVTSTGDVTFAAGNEITLLPGFTAVAGSQFLAYIDAGLGLGKVMPPAVAANSVVDEVEDPGLGELTIPSIYSLAPAYPNPFNPTTTIRFGLPEDASARLVVYDLMGREVARLLERTLAAGYHSIVWNGKNAAGAELPSGLYIARLLASPAAGTSPGFTQTIKMVLLK